MKIWIFKMEATTFGETSVEIAPCATKEIAKSCMDFRKEELSQLDSFQDYGDIEYLNDALLVSCTPNERYYLSIFEEEVRTKSAWEE